MRRMLPVSLLISSIAAQGWLDVSNPANTPGGRSNAGMCYDEAHGYCLLSSGDTWTYDGANWTQLNPANQPSVAGRFPGGPEAVDFRMVYDASRSLAVLGVTARYFQPNAYRYGVAFFEWDGQDWMPGPTYYNASLAGSPCGNQLFDMVYDRSAGRILVFTVDSGTYAIGPRTWIYGSTSLTQASPLVTPPLMTLICPSSTYGQFSMFYDEGRQRIAMIAQNPPSYWEWSNATSNWSQCFPGYLGTPISSGSFGPIAFSPVQNTGIGLGVDQPYTTRTLAYGNRDVMLKFLTAMPAVRYDYSIAFDRQRMKFVLFGGSGYADTWELDLGPAAAFSTFGTGCPGAGGTPTLAANSGLPVAGQPFYLQVSGMPWQQPAFMFLGLSNTTYAGRSLPFDLGALGAPACMLRASGDFLYGVPNVLGVGLWNLSTPNAPGLSFYTQALCMDPSANTLGLIVSNAGHAVIGN